MKFVHLLSRVTGTLWFITEDALRNVSALLESRIAGIALQPAEAVERKPLLAASPGVAVIPIHGIIGKRLSPMEMMCGGADIEAIEAAFDQANADPAVSRIKLHIDSPGGTVVGVPELARKIYDTKRKPVEAVSDTMIGSAAYYLASAADSITVTPTTTVGSIGAVLQVRETIDTKAADGRSRLRVFRSGDDKFAGADAPLTEAQATAYQTRVDHLGNMFRADVVKARPRISTDSMTGLAYFAEEAKARHLVDHIVPSLAPAAP
jgi:ClpP class serine protease